MSGPKFKLKDVDQWEKDSILDEDKDGVCSKSNYNKLYKGHDRTSNYQYDYVLCGDDGEDFGCKNISWNDWDSMWGNCHPALLPAQTGENVKPGGNLNADVSKGWKGELGNQDPCYNSAESSTEGAYEFDIDEGEYDPISDTCPDKNYPGKSKSSFDDDCHLGNVRASDLPKGVGNNMRPAFVINTDFLQKTGIFDNDDGQFDSVVQESSLETCPSTHRRELHCELSGENTSETMGCGKYYGPGRDENGLGRFCSRPRSDYNNMNIADCCLYERKSKTDSSKKNCPMGYCSGEMDYNPIDKADSSCKIPINGKCKQMTKKCNDFFKKECSKEVFLNKRDKLYSKCLEWGFIMPESFSEKATEICDLSFIDDDKFSIDNKEHKKKVKEILSMGLCREYIKSTLHDGSTVQRLDKICGGGQKKIPGEDKWIQKSSITKDPILKNICPCYYKNEFYDWYKKDKISSTEGCKEGDKNCVSQKVSTALNKHNVNPPCFYPECTRSLFYDLNKVKGGCPSIQLCVQTLNNKVDVSTD
jgi:hypothetical protein